MTKETLLENLCRVAGRQGGTIHDYLDMSLRSTLRFIGKYHHEVSCDIQYNNKKSFEVLADEVSTPLKW